MKISLVGAHPLRGDRDDHPSMANIAGALAAGGVDVTVYATRHDASTPATVDVDGYRVVQSPNAIGTDAADVIAALNDFTRFLADEWASNRPDVVHAESWMHGVAAQLASDHHAIPAVQSFPELGAVLSRRQSRVVGPPARTRLERLVARSATRVVAACSEDVGDLIRMGVPRARIVVLPQGVDVDVFSTTGPVADRAADSRIVAAVGDLLPHQGLDDLVRATAKLPTTELMIVGGPAAHLLDGDDEARRLRRLAEAAGVARRVRLVGALPAEQRAAVLRSADVFCCPSWYEPSNVHVLEAMACGVAVVASEAGGMADAVVNDVTGVLIPPRRPAKLLGTLSAMLYGGMLREGMGFAGRARARSCYAWDRVAVEAENVHRRAIEDHRPATDRPSSTDALAR